MHTKPEKKKNNIGRPSTFAKSLDDLICMYLWEHGGRAEWGELKRNAREKALEKREIHDGVLGAALKRLQENSLIVPSPELKDGKAATVYHLHPHLHTAPLDLKEMLTDATIQGKIEQDDDLRAMEASRTIDIALDMLKLTIRDELALYANNKDREEAERRFENVLLHFILPLYRKIAEVSIIPGACGDKAREVADHLTIKTMELHDYVWIRGTTWFEEAIKRILEEEHNE